MGYSLWRLTRRVVTVVVLVTIGVLSPASAAVADGAFVGACTIELDVTFSRPLGLGPAAMVLGVRGGGSCVVNAVEAPMRMEGTLATTALTGGFGCGGGVATGSGAIEVDIEGFPGPPITLAVVAVGPVVELTAVNITPSLVRFEGVGALAVDPDDVVACPAGTVTSTTWTGGFVFQDPEPSPV